MRQSPTLALLVGAAFLLRILFATTQATAPVHSARGGDEYRYIKLGYDLISGRSYADQGISSAPLYPLSVGLILRPFLIPQSAAQTAALQAAEALPPETLRDAAAPIHLLRIWGALLGAALVWLVYQGARQLSGDERAATLAALAVAIGPAFIRETAVIGTETLYMALLVGGLVAALGESTPRRAAGCGLLLALATLTRMPPLLLPPLLALLWWWFSPRRRSALRPALALLASFAAVLALWALYTTLAWGRPVLISDTSVGAVVFRGAIGGGEHHEINEQVTAITGVIPTQESDRPYEEAAWFVISEDPLGYLLGRGEELLLAALQPHGTLHFSGPSLKAMLRDWWRAERDGSGLLAIARAPGFGGKALLWAFHLVALGGGLLGAWRLFARAQNRRALATVALALAYTCALHFWLEANARYLFPNEPLWWMLAGYGLLELAETVQRRVMAA